MTRSEIVLLRDSTDDPAILNEARSIFSQMGILYREEVLPTLPTLSALKQLIEGVSAHVIIVTAGRGSYTLPFLAASVTPQHPLIVMPCPSQAAPYPYLRAIFDNLRGYPVAFTRPYDAQAAALLAVHLLVSRHPSYADLLSAFVHKRQFQTI